ncbi:hypothetical protein ACM55M_11235 [Flavobacterium sp. ZT3R25]|uniref:hypothetical protein n=1 Tax=Flavobacterium galactosi TaxID=3398735 RepID=UPI003A84A441
MLPLYISSEKYSASSSVINRTNTTSLGQYADIPVGNYTGVPNIDISLFDVKSGKIELPIRKFSWFRLGIKCKEE